MNHIPLPPLCVDLDNSFIKTDLSIVQFKILLKTKSYLLPYLIIQFMKSREAAKNYMAPIIPIDYSIISLNQKVYNYCKEQKSTGRTIILVTGSNELLAKQISQEYPIFDEVYGSTISINLIGKNKALFLLKKFGKNNFDYIGDHKVDLPIWSIARKAILVSNSKNKKLSTKISNLDKII